MDEAPGSTLRRWWDDQATRRSFLAGVGLAILGACGAKKPSSTPPSTGAPSGAETLSVLGTGGDAPPLNPGPNRIGFALIDQKGNALTAGSPVVKVAKQEAGQPTTVRATWHP